MKSSDVKYDNLLVYYFSGTGNARRSAEWICRFAGQEGLNTRIINIDRFKEVIVPDMPEGRTMVGLCYPTHGFNAPPIIYRFIRKMPRSKCRHLFLINTRAGMKLSKIFLPGISGLAMIWPAILLMIKGYRINAMQPVDLPSNWISIHPGLKKKVVASIFERWHRKLKKFTSKLIRGNWMYPNMVSLPIDLFLVPVSIGYFYFGRYMLAKTFISTSACTSCNICENRCPTGSIRMINGRPYWKYSCESCMRCMNICPHRAIETTQTISGLLWYLCWSVIPGWLMHLLFKHDVLRLENQFLVTLLFYFIMIPLSFFMVYVAYRLLRYGMRYRIINKIVSYTSFTHFKFWRRYNPDISL